jgi:glycosyltransferase involved in cell wall biosynthesis
MHDRNKIVDNITIENSNHPGRQTKMDLSVVLISRNQEWNISRLIGSVLRCLPDNISTEVVLVDSASTDRTIEIARTYPVKIFQLKPDQILTPSAGRWVGTRFSTGDFILFLDGDMELCEGWVERALLVMQTMPDVAVVCGPWINLPKAMQRDDVSVDTNSAEEGYSFAGANIGGAALYRRSVLNEVGTFNPYLYSDEEPELSIRIRHAGYDMLKLNHPIAYHYSDPSEAISTLIQRWKRNLWLGMGQSIRYHIGDKLFWTYVKERGFGCLPALILLVGGLSFFYSLFINNWTSFILWLLILLLGMAGIAVRRRSFYRMIYSVVQRLLVLDGTVRGLFIRPMDPETYPCNIEKI